MACRMESTHAGQRWLFGRANNGCETRHGIERNGSKNEELLLASRAGNVQRSKMSTTQNEHPFSPRFETPTTSRILLSIAAAWVLCLGIDLKGCSRTKLPVENIISGRPSLQFKPFICTWAISSRRCALLQYFQDRHNGVQWILVLLACSVTTSWN